MTAVAVPHPDVAGRRVDPCSRFPGRHLERRAGGQTFIDVSGKKCRVRDRDAGIGGAHPRSEIDRIDVDPTIGRDPRGTVQWFEFGAQRHDGERAILGLGEKSGRYRFDVIGRDVVPTSRTTIGAEHPDTTGSRGPRVTDARLGWRAHRIVDHDRRGAVLGLGQLVGAQRFDVVGRLVVPTGSIVSVVVEDPAIAVLVDIGVAESRFRGRTFDGIGTIRSQQFFRSEVRVLAIDVRPPHRTRVDPFGAVVVDVSRSLNFLGARIRRALWLLVTVGRDARKIRGGDENEFALSDSSPVRPTGRFTAPGPDIAVRVRPRTSQNFDGARLLRRFRWRTLLRVTRDVG